ncbi:MAG: response regulator [Nitrospirales bacterium]
MAERPPMILVVDDEAYMVFMIKNILERAGYTVLTAPTVEQAMDLCQAHRDRIDLLIADVVLNPTATSSRRSLTGFHLACWIAPLCPKARVLLVSGADPQRINSLGGVPPGAAFLSKPFEAETLLSMVGRLLTDRQETRGS